MGAREAILKLKGELTDFVCSTVLVLFAFYGPNLYHANIISLQFYTSTKGKYVIR